MEEFSDILAKAASAVSEQYFRLAIAEGDPVYRERVYCYELYHQMRLRWPNNEEALSLSGEVDKKGHPVLKALNLGKPIPDFLIHKPGSMDRNFAVIEVKPQSASSDGVCKDIATLSNFLNGMGYTRAIYLIYGEGLFDGPLDKICALANSTGLARGIELWAHFAPGEEAREITRFE